MNLATTFYRPCLQNSRRYDRAVGYFRSSVFLLIGPDLLSLALRGGQVRLICSPSLTEEDYYAIREGYESQDRCIQKALNCDIDALLSVTETISNAEALATLVSCDVIKVKLAFRIESKGIYHEKIGLFYDDLGNCVSFKGSTNETWNGWHERGNFESFDVFCNWVEGKEAIRVDNNRQYFERLWANSVDGLTVIDFPRVVKDRLSLIAKGTIRDIDPNGLRDYFVVNQRDTDTNDSEKLINHTPKRTPLPHQVEALAAWEAQGRHGILEHATGSGKTFTALVALKEHLSPEGIALILVPGRLLQRQWQTEIKKEFSELKILKAGGGHNRWRQNETLRSFTSPQTGLGKRVVLATMQTARKTEFIQGLHGGAHLMIIADEVHEVGSPKNSMILSIESGARLGLSATPQRYGDAEGTRKILDYFSSIVEPPYRLIDALNDGRLVPYEYHPKTVKLTNDESHEWASMTKIISVEYARAKKDKEGNAVISSSLRNKLIQRARIAKKAKGKVPLAVNILRQHFSLNQSWLVYCEDQAQLEEMMSALKSERFSPLEYHTNMESCPDESIDHFKKFGGIMCAIRCLDQGVDIPKITHAIILASSQNPRQFIQRRGRVLRIAPGKQKASIFDAVVVPDNLSLEPEQRSLSQSEFRRSFEFATNAQNHSSVTHELTRLAIELEINLNEIGPVDGVDIEEDTINE